MKINRSIEVKLIENFNLSTSLKPESDDLIIEEGKEVTYLLGKEPKVKLDKPLPQAILSYLCDKSPQTVGYKEIIVYLDKILPEKNIKMSGDLNSAVCGFLMKCYINGVVEFSSITPRLVNEVSEFPKASPLARHQAQLRISVTDQRHKPRKLNLFYQQLISLLNGENDLKVAIPPFIIATLIALVVVYFLERRIPMVPLLSGILITLFGGLTIYFDNKIFFYMKPTIINLLFATVLFFGKYFTEKPLLKMFFQNAFNLKDEGWKKLNYRWINFFIFMAILNEIVWRTQSEAFWVNFKVWGLLPISFLFAASQVPLINKYKLKQ